MKLNDYKEKFKYHSLSYISEQELGDIIFDDENKMISLFFDPEQEILILRYAVNSIDDLIDVLKEEKRKVLIPFVDPSFVSDLKQLGYEVRSIFKDYFKRDFSDVEKSEDFTECLISESLEASKLTHSVINQSRGFFGQSEIWFKTWMDGTSDDVKDMGLKHQTVLVKKNEQKKMIGLVVVGLYGYDSDSGPTVWIRELVVDQNYQGMGIGQNLLSDGLSYGKAHGAKKAFLHVDELNENAIHIYRKFGFYPTEDSQIDMIKS